MRFERSRRRKPDPSSSSTSVSPDPPDRTSRLPKTLRWRSSLPRPTATRSLSSYRLGRASVSQAERTSPGTSLRVRAGQRAAWFIRDPWVIADVAVSVAVRTPHSPAPAFQRSHGEWVSGRVVRLIWDDAVAVLGQLQAAANLGYTLATQRGLQIALVAKRSTQGGARIRQHTGDDPRLIRPEPFPVRQAYNGPALCGCDALDCGRPTRTAVAGGAGASQASVPTESSRAPRRTRPSRGPATASSGSPRRCSEYSASMMQGRPTSESGLANFGKRAAGYSPPRLVLRSTPTRTTTSGSGYSWPLVSATADCTTLGTLPPRCYCSAAYRSGP